MNRAPYEGPLKPCPHCGSEEVEYLVAGIHGRLRCVQCDKWLEDKAHKMEEWDYEQGKEMETT